MKKTLLSLLTLCGAVFSLAPAGVAAPPKPAEEHVATGVITRNDDLAIVIQDGGKKWEFISVPQAEDADFGQVSENVGTKVTVHYKLVITSLTIEGAGAAPVKRASLGPTITPAEMKAIERIQNLRFITFGTPLTDQDSYLYKFTVSGNEKMMSVSSRPKGNQAPDDTYHPGVSGYAWYDDKGQIIGKAHGSQYKETNDVMPDHTLPKAGTYYLKVVGPGTVELVVDGDY